MFSSCGGGVAVMLCTMAVLGGAAPSEEPACGPCPAIPKHYEELGCTGHTVDGGCCPVRFECPDLKSYASDKCMFRGRAYEHGQAPADNLEADCNAACRCLEHGGKASFECAQIECPDLFNGVEPGCVPQRSLSTCCAAKSVCGEEAKNLPECYHDGKRHVQGDTIYPADEPCQQCVCDAGWDNSTRIADNKNCRRLDCGIELRSLHRLRSGCVPVYFGEKSCCPIDYRCPKTTDEVMPFEGRSGQSDDPKMVCTFDALTLQRGQQLKSTDKCIECACRNPPMVDCVRIPKC